MNSPTNKPFLSFDEVLLILNIKAEKFDELILKNGIREFRDKGQRFFKTRDIFSYKEKRKQELLGGTATENQKLPNDNSNIITIDDIDNTLAKTREMLLKRLMKHGDKKFNSPAEALGTLTEEYHETIDEVRSNDNEKFCDEMMDVAVTGIVAYISFKKT